jgi:hypothetical protein
MSKTDIEQLAVMFRVNDPNLGHVSVWDKLHELNLAYTYGLYRGTPERYTRKRHQMREAIARELDRKAARQAQACDPYNTRGNPDTWQEDKREFTGLKGF